MNKIIGISGKKQSGKNTVANYINGDILKERNMIQDFFLNDLGELVIKTTNHNGESGYGVLDINRKDRTFKNYADTELWPYVKVYSFADDLKQLCINIFGLTNQQVYGTNEQKNSETNILWKDLPLSKKKKGKVTSREFMQYFGTTIVRRIKDDAWVYSTMNKIAKEDSEVAIIADVRFPNEVKAIKDAGGIVIRMTRNIFDDEHDCEKALDKENFDWNNFDHVIDNKDSSIEELSKMIKNKKSIWS